MIGVLEEKFHTLWHFLGNFFETVLFFLVGGYIGRYFTENSIKSFINFTDLIYVFIF